MPEIAGDNSIRYTVHVGELIAKDEVTFNIVIMILISSINSSRLRREFHDIFFRLLVDVYPKCRETKLYSCFVMDRAGFLIMHEDFLLSSATTKDVEQVHITEKEKTIAEDLIKKKYLIKKECRNVKKIQTQSFYEIKLPRGGVDALIGGERCAKYQLGEIVGTNALLGSYRYVISLYIVKGRSPKLE